jgi:hypothetical protein
MSEPRNGRSVGLRARDPHHTPRAPRRRGPLTPYPSRGAGAAKLRAPLDFVPDMFSCPHAGPTRSSRRSGAYTASATCTRCTDARAIAASTVLDLAAL